MCAVSGWVLLIRRVLNIRLFHKVLPIRIGNLSINPKRTRRSNRNTKISRNSVHNTNNVNSYSKLKLMYCEASESTILNLVRHRLIYHAVAWCVSTRSSVEWYTMLLLSHLPGKWSQEIPPYSITNGLVNYILT